MAEVFKYDDFADQDYERDFWQGQRRYEDKIERETIKKLLPKKGDWFVELGAGFGRLTNLYAPKYTNVVLFDYSETLIKKAVEKYKGKDNIIYVLGDVYKMPFADNLFDAILMVRVLHHIENAPDLFKEVKRTVNPNGRYVMEFPNKRNILEILRYMLKRKSLNPFAYEPEKRDKLYYNFHPAYIKDMLGKYGFSIKRKLTSSNFRSNIFKKVIPTGFLVSFESLIQPLLSLFPLSPSVFVSAKQNGTKNALNNKVAKDIVDIFICPECRAKLEFSKTEASCAKCKLKFPIKDNVYDFRIEKDK